VNDAATNAQVVDVSVVRALRGEVLRAGRPPEASVMPDDDHPQSRHVAVYLDDELVSVGSVLPGAPPWAEERAPGWRIRGMATRDGYRGRGLGNLVLSDLIDYSRAQGDGVVWCAARIGATRFYARSGFVTHGGVFIADDVEHIYMWRSL
jgi:predicted GNAT family N-acyltransferase